VGMAQIFTALPGMAGLMAYWYHFAIMFEALFILTTVDAGTRIGRFLLQEFLGRAYKPFANPTWVPGSVVATALIVSGWGYLIYGGSINTIWPAFAVANQLLASVALATATTIIIRLGKARYAWVTLAPFLFLFTNTMWGGFLNIRDNYWPLATGPNPAMHTQGYVLAIMTAVIMICAVIILANTVAKCLALLSGNGREPVPAES
jgi:carbon starvation protein